MIINKEEIKQLLPHREPFLFLDKCEIVEIGKKVLVIENFCWMNFFLKVIFLKCLLFQVLF